MLIEFDGQVSIAEFERLTPKERYYLRLERQASNDRVRDELEKQKKEAENAKKNRGASH